ncbi:MAG: hypothetical protein PUC23_01305 [bacterium]|nr:hypothetical protein [bacterium]
MKKEVFCGKTIEEAKENALNKLNLLEDEVIFKEIKESKSLFNKKCEVEVIKKEDITAITKEFIINIVKLMGLNPKIEHKVRDGILYFNVIVEKAPVLIGRNGKTIESLQIITNDYLKQELGFPYRIYIDICDYKKQKEVKFIRLAKQIAKDVARTGCEIKLDPMNSYERRIIHNALANNKEVRTESFGEEPNRYVVIKPRD